MKRWGIFLGLSAFLAVGWFCRPYLATIPDLCMFKHLCGIGCPGCGLTRSVAATVHFDFRQAIQFHIFGPLFVFGAIVAWGGALFDVRVPWNDRWTTVRLGISIALLLLYYGLRVWMGIVP